MARIRSIKPELFADEKLAPLDVMTRFVFIGLICMADDGGRILDNVRQIDALLFPETENDTCREALATLAGIGRIIRGRTSSGQRVIQIANWTKHQKVDHPNLRAALPELVAGEADATAPDNVANDSRASREILATRSTISDQRSTNNDHRPASDAHARACQEFLAEVPDVFRPDVEGALRAAKNPDSLIRSVRGIAAGLSGQVYAITVQCQAIQEIIAAGRQVTPMSIRTFSAKIVERPPATPAGVSPWDAAAARLEDQDRTRSVA